MTIFLLNNRRIQWIKKQIKENIVKIRNNGIKLWTEDGKLRFKAPKGAMNDNFFHFFKG